MSVQSGSRPRDLAKKKKKKTLNTLRKIYTKCSKMLQNSELNSDFHDFIPLAEATKSKINK